MRSVAATGNPGRRRIGWRFTKHIYLAYAERVSVVGLGLVNLALALDLSSTLPGILETHDGGILDTFLLVGRYIGYRGIDNLTDFLPIVGFLGVLWAEVTLTIHGERTALEAIGRSWRDYITPAVLFGASLALLQFALSGYLRPGAVEAQAQERLGHYVSAFINDGTGDSWIQTDQNILLTALAFGPPVQLLQPILYQHDASGHLIGVASASRATQIASGQWRFLRGTYITFTEDPPSSDPQDFEVRDFPVDLSPLWLSTLGISATNLDQERLHQLAREPLPPTLGSEYVTGWQARFSIPALTGAMVLQAAATSWLLLAARVGFRMLLIVGLCGYVVHASGKQLLVVGQHGHMPAVVAAWLTPALLGACLVALGIVAALRERRRFTAFRERLRRRNEEMLAHKAPGPRVAPIDVGTHNTRH